MYGGSIKLTQQAAAKQAQQHAVVTADPKLQVVTSALYQSRYIISEFIDKLLEAGKQCSNQAMQGQTETRTNSGQAQTMEKQENVQRPSDARPMRSHSETVRRHRERTRRRMCKQCKANQKP